MVQGIERDPEDRIKDVEDELHGDGTEPGLVGKVDLFGRFVVQTNKRLERLEPPAGMLRDWFTVTDPQTATQWLDELDQWRGRVLDHIKPDLLGDRGRPKRCWLYHPTVVGRLIALHGAWVLAHKGRIDSVLALWCRYLDDMTDRIGGERGELGKCEPGKHTTDYAHYFAVSEGDWDHIRNDYVTWWCGPRKGDPPGLMPA